MKSPTDKVEKVKGQLNRVLSLCFIFIKKLIGYRECCVCHKLVKKYHRLKVCRIVEDYCSDCYYYLIGD